MLFLFKKIRHSLMNNGKIARYLLYATGEILLVVIGILIALQVNNLNENRKDLNLERVYYKSLLIDLERDSLEYVEREENANGNLKKLANIISFIESGYDTLISFEPVNWVTANTEPFEGNSALAISLAQAGFVQFPLGYDYVISDLRSTGNLRLLRNDTLKNKILDYYNREKLYSLWRESYLQNRIDIDLEINYILDEGVRGAYNEEAEFQRYYELDMKELISRMKQRPALKPLAVGMSHIHRRIIRNCQREKAQVHQLMLDIRRELSRS